MVAAPPALMFAVSVTAVVVTVLVEPVEATGADVAATACVVRVPPEVDGAAVVVEGVVVVVAPLELLGEDEADDGVVAPPPEDEAEDDAPAGHPRR